ncbi:MAG: ABC-type multidrug transport system ATPase subunit [Arenicella sp.]
MGYLPQDSFLPSNLKVRKAISLFCKSRTEVEELESEPMLKPILDTKCGDISGGESRVLEILLVLNSKANYILMDEPFNGVAPIYKEQIKEWIRAKSNQKGFIITDHDYENILSASTRLMLMHDGGTKQLESRSELVEWGYLRAE